MEYDTYPSCSLDARRQAQAGRDNIYLPDQAIIRNIIRENSLVNTYELTLVDELANHRFSFQPGQFMMISMPHLGEAPISFSSSPDGEDGFSLTIRNSGRLTAAVQQLRAGDIIGVRGPYGRPFPADRLEGKNLLFVAGGIGLAPLRPLIEYWLSRPDEAGNLTMFYGSRTPEEFCFNRDFSRWEQNGLNLRLTVDQTAEEWDGSVGLVTSLLDGYTIDDETMALVCGPGIMIRFVFKQLQAMGMKAENIITTLERHMKCGVGICGHCHMEEKLVCIDGPVFTAAELPDPDNP
ncbi:MAG: FAD/NAD(P)-binding protein [Desulfobulbaceae bacterium]|nr:FAD/NAD(P)-binding protein [Desulfobulbaceae bacterium]